jgi:hypothetical protein
MENMENNLMRPLLISFTAAIVFVAAVAFAPAAQAMTIATPAGLNAAIQQTDVKQNVHYWRRRAYWGVPYRPLYRPYVYRPYYRAYGYYPIRPYRPWWFRHRHW